MSNLDDNERAALARALRDAVPEGPPARSRALAAELLGRRMRRRRQGAAVLGAAAVLAAIAAGSTLVGRNDGSDTPGPSSTSPATPTTSAQRVDEELCKGGFGADHTDLSTGDAVFIQFCPLAGTWNGLVASPREALTEGVDELLASWQPEELHGCTIDPITDRYRFQVVYADGSYAQIIAATGDCQPIVNGDQTTTGTGEEMFAQVMAAYGDQYAARFESAEPVSDELVCPDNLLDPEQTDVERASASLAATGIVVPLSATRGLLCTGDGSAPLDQDAAERVRVTLQSIPGGEFDCTPSDDPTYAVVLEDKTGTRRTISSDGAQCGAIVTAFRGGPTGNPGRSFPLLLGELAQLGPG